MRTTLLYTWACLMLIFSGFTAFGQAYSASENSVQDELALVSEEQAPMQAAWDYFIYPVPARDEINIRVTRGFLNILEVQILDEEGNSVISVDGLSGVRHKIDLNGLDPGKYTIQVLAEDNTSRRSKRFYIIN